MSTFLRLRSNPACNIEDGPPLSSLLGDSRSVSPEGPYFMAVPSRSLTLASPSAAIGVQAGSISARESRRIRLLRHGVVDRPELRGRRGRGAEGVEGGQQALGNERLRVLLGLPHLDYPPAAVRARASGVEDAAGGLLQAEPLADTVVDLLRTLGVVDHHRDRHGLLLPRRLWPGGLTEPRRTL